MINAKSMVVKSYVATRVPTTRKISAVSKKSTSRKYRKKFFRLIQNVPANRKLKPEQVHYGQAQQILQQRTVVLESAFKDHAKRFKGRMPKPFPLPKAAWINKPDESQAVLL